MMRMAVVLAAVWLGLADAAVAQDRVTLGWGRLFSNDTIADGKDRWRTGAYSVSRVRGYRWDGALPQQFGEILELRARAEIVAPADLVTPLAVDRRYAALLSFGLHTHFDWRGIEVSLGSDLVFAGPQTGISGFQSFVHNVIGLPKPTVIDDQLGNAVYPTLVAEFGRKMTFGDAISLRPFIEAEAGVETFVRVGGDLVIGTLGRDDLMLRDPGTGQRYRVVEGGRNSGTSIVLGADVARVFDSVLLPSTGAATPSDQRTRLRAGVHWQGEKASVFYGVSYLGREFVQQPTGQVVGALNLNLKF